jgi:sugar lactone lactonase YvrE
VLPAGKVSRLNDGGCDPAGRFLVGSLALDDRERDEVLVRIESSGQ